MISPLARISVGVVIERRMARSPWAGAVWRPVAVLSGAPEKAPWTELVKDGEVSLFYVGRADIELYRSETGNYRDNLTSGSPSVWIVLSPRGGDRPYDIAAVTVDPAEGEGRTEPGDLLVEAVAMPKPVYDAIAAFVAQHHIESVFSKRTRDRANPEALARRTPAKEDGDERS